jgi:hypothetical protein
MSNSDDDEEANIIEAVLFDEACEQCGQPLKEADRNLATIAGMKTLHKTCADGLRCLDRMVKKPNREELKRSVERARRHEPLKFAAIVAALTKQDGKSRSKDDRERAMEFCELMFEDESDIRNEKSLMMPKLMFLSWHKTNCSMTQKEAEDKWQDDKLNTEVHNERDRRGRLCVEVEMPIEIIKQHKSTRRRQVDKSKGVAGDDFNASKFLKRDDDFGETIKRNLKRPVKGLGDFMSSGDENESKTNSSKKSKVPSSCSDRQCQRSPAPSTLKRSPSPCPSRDHKRVASGRGGRSKRTNDDGDDEENEDDDGAGSCRSIATSAAPSTLVAVDTSGDPIMPNYEKGTTPAAFYLFKKTLVKAVTQLLGDYTEPWQLYLFIFK